MSIPISSEQYKKQYIAFQNAIKAWMTKNHKKAVTKEEWNSILQQAQKAGLQVRGNKIVAPVRIERPKPQPQQKTQPKPKKAPVKAFWVS